MAILPILCYPDPRLHKVAQPVQAVDARIQSLVSDMLARTADVGQHQEAARMEQAGESREAIWRKTGWWKGPDGQWRF